MPGPVATLFNHGVLAVVTGSRLWALPVVAAVALTFADRAFQVGSLSRVLTCSSATRLRRSSLGDCSAMSSPRPGPAAVRRRSRLATNTHWADTHRTRVPDPCLPLRPEDPGGPVITNPIQVGGCAGLCCGSGCEEAVAEHAVGFGGAVQVADGVIEALGSDEPRGDGGVSDTFDHGYEGLAIEAVDEAGSGGVDVDLAGGYRHLVVAGAGRRLGVATSPGRRSPRGRARCRDGSRSSRGRLR